jgi:hypothetical protein
MTQLPGSRASHQAVAELKAEGVLPAQTLVRANKYLNDMIEQDQRTVRPRLLLCLLFDDLLSLQPRANRSFQNLPLGKRKATIYAVNHSSKQYLFPPGKDSP